MAANLRLARRLLWSNAIRCSQSEVAAKLPSGYVENSYQTWIGAGWNRESLLKGDPYVLHLDGGAANK